MSNTTTALEAALNDRHSWGMAVRDQEYKAVFWFGSYELDHPIQIEEAVVWSPEANSWLLCWARAPYNSMYVDGTANPSCSRQIPANTEHARSLCRPSLAECFIDYYKLPIAKDSEWRTWKPEAAIHSDNGVLYG